MEIWKDIEGYEGLYEISSQGRVKSLNYFGHKNKSGILKMGIHMNWYYVVGLTKDNKRTLFTVHRLVYQTFIGELIDDLVIDHIDGNSLNNNVDNLQQITQRENTIKGERTKNGSSVYVGVCWNKHKNKWQTRIYINGKCKFLGRFDNEEEAAQAYQNALEALNQID